MNVLLTGGAGYIGSHTAVALAESLGALISEKNHHIVLLDNLCNSELRR